MPNKGQPHCMRASCTFRYTETPSCIADCMGQLSLSDCMDSITFFVFPSFRFDLDTNYTDQSNLSLKDQHSHGSSETSSIVKHIYVIG